jgi:hypothetical protein
MNFKYLVYDGNEYFFTNNEDKMRKHVKEGNLAFDLDTETIIEEDFSLTEIPKDSSKNSP